MDATFSAVEPPPTHHLEMKTLQSTTHLWPSFDEFQCIQVLRFLVLCEHHCAIGTTIKVLNLQTILQVAAEEKLETVVPPQKLSIHVHTFSYVSWPCSSLPRRDGDPSAAIFTSMSRVCGHQHFPCFHAIPQDEKKVPSARRLL